MAAVELMWQAGPIAIAWKVIGVPVADEVAKGTPVPAKSNGKTTRSGGRSSQPSVCAWAEQQFNDKWVAAHPLSTLLSGLVLLVRCSNDLPSPIRGTYALLIAPVSVPPQAMLMDSADAEVKALWEPLGLFGGINDEPIIVQEVASGHFGRIALVEFDVLFSMADTAAVLRLVLELQDLGFVVLHLSGVRGSEIRNPELLQQTEEQTDVLPGTCASLVGITLPPTISHTNTRRLGQIAKHGCVTHAPPAKFVKLLHAEQALAKQRFRPLDGIIEFHGLSLLVPQEQLRPRESSVALVDAALSVLGNSRSKAQVLDLGVGCGALLLAILQSLGESSCGTGVDIDDGAVQACQSNISRLLTSRHAAQVKVILADFAQLDTSLVRPQLAAQGYDVIVCNPPYRSNAQQQAYDLASGQYGGHTEHYKTLVAGETGLEMYEAVAACIARDAAQVHHCVEHGIGAGPLLRANGTLIFQVEAGTQGKAGGVVARVGAAVERAAKGQLRVCDVCVDRQGLERAILVRHAVDWTVT